MDLITHSIFAAVAGKLWFRKKWAVNVIVFSALLPDLDYVSRLFGPEAFLRFNRGLSHGLMFLFLAPVVVGLIAARTKGGRRPIRRHFEFSYLLALIGYGSHIVLDLLDSHGVGLFAPLEARRYAIGSLHATDPIMALVLIAALYFSRKRKYAKKALVAALVFCVIYVSGRTVIKHSALSFARTSMDTHIVKTVTPMSFSLWQWWYVAYQDTGGKHHGGKRTGIVDLFSDNVYEAATYPRDARGEAVKAAGSLEVVRSFLDAFPNVHVDTVRDDEGSVIVTYTALDNSCSGDTCCRVVVYLNQEGHVLERKVIF